MSDEFDDYEQETDDSAALEAYVEELADAVAAFDAVVLEPGEVRLP